jgi:hypothetical protein
MSEDDLETAVLLDFPNAAKAGITAAKHLIREARRNFRRTIMVAESHKNKTGTGRTHRKAVYVKADTLEKRNLGGGPPTVSLCPCMCPPKV